MIEQRKVALITGSAKGLGKMTALRLADSGCDIIINYVHSAVEAQKLCERIQAKGVRCLALQGDVSRYEDLQYVTETAVQELGGIDICINNAGPFVRERKFFNEYKQEEIQYIMNGNLLGVMQLDHLVLPMMRSKKWGESFTLDSGMPQRHEDGLTGLSTPRPRLGLSHSPKRSQLKKHPLGSR